MTLEATQYLITDLALKRNLVNCAMSGPSVYAINPEEIREYPLIFVSPVGSHTIKENTTRYSFTIFYMDRLLEDTSNEDTIGSAGLETLRNLKLQLSKIEVITDIQEEVDIRLFTETERMADRVAGAYMTIWIETLNPSTCPAFFDEYGFYLGNYFATEGLEAVLDALASKEYVNRAVAAASISGMTPEEFEEILSDYVLEKNFATINGDKITNRKKFALVDQSAYTQDIQNIYQAISGATPEDYSELREQVSANTTDIAALQETDSLIFIINNNSTQADINALVEAVLDTGNTQWGKITLFYKTNTYSDDGYVVLRPYYRYRPRTDYEVYFRGVVANNAKVISLFLVGFSRNTMQQSVDRRDYDMSKYVPNNEFRTVNGQTLIGAGYGDITVGNVRSESVFTITEITQIAYDALATKDPNTLYIIKG